VDGLGTNSLATLYGALIISCMFLPSLMIKRFTTKWTMVMCMLCYSTYIAAQIKPEYYTLIPTAIILGLGAAPMWSSKCKYLTQVGNRYAEITGQAAEHVIVRFFGIFFLLFQSSSIWGNLISSEGSLRKVFLKIGRLTLDCFISIVLKIGANETVGSINTSFCGANYHPEDNNSVVDSNFEVDDETVNTLAGIYLACGILGALLVALTVDPLYRFPGIVDSDDTMSGLSLLIATFKQMKNPYQILIIPLTIWSGFEQAFLGADFTAVISDLKKLCILCIVSFLGLCVLRMGRFKRWLRPDLLRPLRCPLLIQFWCYHEDHQEEVAGLHFWSLAQCWTYYCSIQMGTQQGRTCRVFCHIWSLGCL
jgi:hypothetical protein